MEKQIKSDNLKKISTLGELKKSGYKPKSVKEELRDNLISALSSKKKVFDGIKGFDDTVLPDIERAILSRHNILLLGLRGQAKTKIARLLTQLLDEWVPIIAGSSLNEDPLQPLTKDSKLMIEKNGDKTPVEWIHRDERYVEKLATPDVSVADLIGDMDPIKAANLRLSFADESAIHFGLVARAHRSIFVINELPDLQPRIQVSLFNILQEGDLQIRGFKLRLPLDIQFVFTANPEDYTNRGSIITPLKDRIESQILTHYPTNIEIAKEITANESSIHKSQKSKVNIYDLHRDLLEYIVFEARESELVDEKSGVSARLSISAIENLASAAERRSILNNEKKTSTRIQDFWGVIPAITGKLELVYEGEQEGPYNVAITLIDRAIKKLFLEYFPDPTKQKRAEKDIYGTVKAYFSSGAKVELLNDSFDVDFYKSLDSVPGLDKILDQMNINSKNNHQWKELLLHGLAAFQVLEKNFLHNTMTFDDPLGGFFKEDLEDLD